MPIQYGWLLERSWVLGGAWMPRSEPDWMQNNRKERNDIPQ
jgi:hypothetical protein